MSAERLQFPDWRTREFLLRRRAWDLVSVLGELLRRSLKNLRRPPRADDSIAWEDGEVHEDREARG